ncbi:cytochrome d ubiquinol oxidase subunit II [Lentzea sp. NEAU-D7]|uniref:cytochrome d ubiquinol oxidase subunit II n=1 Tax=Lentzea sp. NEAU-D7 TaxID=2994667 RepID=UPI00224AE518|nr:cytochrome d ubiquinol oxidase subunit II [Lentzea sp. NEAU-D7]MCX2948913.1 cytochrome d ubiquinol oxidase subunit II [Lentzea sp. NEAU-D7]
MHEQPSGFMAGLRILIAFVAAEVAFLALTLVTLAWYASLFGGADFGGEVWDLLAGGTERGHRVRDRIERSIGPVWEANHVWLIFVLVVLWTGFSRAFAAAVTTRSTSRSRWPGSA